LVNSSISQSSSMKNQNKRILSPITIDYSEIKVYTHTHTHPKIQVK